MPIFKFICEKCGNKVRKISDERPEPPVCEDGTTMVCDVGGSTSVLDRLDNGIMPRVVERRAGIKELVHQNCEHRTLKQDVLV